MALQALPDYLTLDEAATVLRVHPQTLRSWEKRGLIRMVRLPGSGRRLVPRSEIDRILDRESGGVRMDKPSSDPEAVRRGERLAAEIKEELARNPLAETLDDLMRRLRGRAWS